MLILPPEDPLDKRLCAAGEATGLLWTGVSEIKMSLSDMHRQCWYKVHSSQSHYTPQILKPPKVQFFELYFELNYDNSRYLVCFLARLELPRRKLGKCLSCFRFDPRTNFHQLFLSKLPVRLKSQSVVSAPSQEIPLSVHIKNKYEQKNQKNNIYPLPAITLDGFAR